MYHIQESVMDLSPLKFMFCKYVWLLWLTIINTITNTTHMLYSYFWWPHQHIALLLKTSQAQSATKKMLSRLQHLNAPSNFAYSCVLLTNEWTNYVTNSTKQSPSSVSFFLMYSRICLPFTVPEMLKNAFYSHLEPDQSIPRNSNTFL